MGKTVAENRKARHNYQIDEIFEAGVMLVGTEVKSLREGTANIAEAYARFDSGELMLLNAYVSEYRAGNQFNHDPKRPRKLLLKKKELARLSIAVQRKGMTIVPLAIYFNDRGIAKVKLGLARGKNVVDKRASEKERDWQRDRERLMRDRG